MSSILPSLSLKCMGVSTALCRTTLLQHRLSVSLLTQLYSVSIVLFSFHCALEFIAYDDGCHLRRYATNPKRSGLTPTTHKMAQTEIVIDKMHFKGHTDQWCRRVCNPYNFPELETVNLRKYCLDAIILCQCLLFFTCR